jgi:hypothetical protein
MGLSCSTNVPCSFNDYIIICNNIETKESSIYNIDEQYNIPYMKKIYKKNNLLLGIINFIQLFLCCILFYILLKYINN